MVKVHRPYSTLRNQPPSVTTILDMLPKPGLPWAAAKETAMYAVLQRDKWSGLPEPEAVDKLRKHHRGVWNGRAAAGTLAHAILERYALDGLSADIDISELIAAAVESAPAWADDHDGFAREHGTMGHAIGLYEWFCHFRPTGCRPEVVVRWPGLYIGQTDLRCTIDGVDWLWDLKTTHQMDEDKGVYGDSYALQLAMYGMARETVDYEVRDAPELKRGWRVVEVGTGPWSRPQRYGVIHLRGDDSYTAYEIPVTRDVERTALRLARAYHGWKAIPENPTMIRKGEVA